MPAVLVSPPIPERLIPAALVDIPRRPRAGDEEPTAVLLCEEELEERVRTIPEETVELGRALLDERPGGPVLAAASGLLASVPRLRLP